MKPLNVLIGAAFLVTLLCSAQGASPAKATPPISAKAAPAVEMPIPESIFNIPLSPRQGRNPFFPYSSAAVPVVTNNASAIDTSTLVLNGITSPPKRMAMINGRSFEVGESGDVKLPNGLRIPVKCVEIYDDKAVFLINGQRRELQLRSK